ncbi:BA14K family protein [Devosia sp. ZB163]|uniref:BA14K family protein n=1 Tax=Devosia sp. ZB163 TaxID=3025938 RepID=UPI00235F8325|nr:BA14K family protein [Devosia sp. ZB163]MDC9822438.1 BA14K family protein [Devosia sp. ZB163]
MRKLALAAVAAAVLGLMATSMPAQAQGRLGYGYSPGMGNRWDGGWNNRRYNNYWNGNRYMNRWGYRPYGWGIGAGAVGLGVGAAIANDRYYNNNMVVIDDNHVAACEAKYRSYNAQTDMFLGYDGQYHRCNL